MRADKNAPTTARSLGYGIEHRLNIFTLIRKIQRCCCVRTVYTCIVLGIGLFVYCKSFIIVLLHLKWILLFHNVAKTTGFTKDIDIVVTDVIWMAACFTSDNLSGAGSKTKAWSITIVTTKTAGCSLRCCWHWVLCCQMTSLNVSMNWMIIGLMNWLQCMTTGRTIILDGCNVIVDRLQPLQLLCGICGRTSRTDCHEQIMRYFMLPVFYWF